MNLEPNTKYVDVSGNVWGDWDGYCLRMYTGDEEIKKGARFAFNRNGRCAGSSIWSKYDISHKLEDKPFELEVGERYFTRDGRLSEPVSLRNISTGIYKFIAVIGGGDGEVYAENGKYQVGIKDHPLDLVRKAVRGVDYDVEVNSDNRPDIVKAVSDSLAYAQRLFEQKNIADEKVDKKQSILDIAKQAIGDRGLNYGKPEENFDRIARLWNSYLLSKQDKALYAEDVACMMILLKVARLQNTPHHTDSWVDIAGYAACGGSLKEKGDE